MFKNFLTLRALRRSLVELSRSPNTHVERVTDQLEKTRHTMLLLNGNINVDSEVNAYEELQRRAADLETQISELEALRLDLIYKVEELLKTYENEE